MSTKKTISKILFLLIGFLVFSGFNRDNPTSEQDCLDCHDNIVKALHERYVHYPVEMKQCDACHNPDTSLNEQVPELCTVCHRDVREEKGAVLHPVADDCTSCHDPHGSKNSALLIEKVPDLCLSCHEGIPEEPKPESVHAPVEDGDCGTCHSPHSSPNTALLKQKPAELCAECHDTTDADFNKKHLNLLKADSRCLSCHQGHSSSKKSLLLENSHLPFAEGMCDGCHDAEQRRLIASGSELCTTCHGDIGELLQGKFPHVAAAEDCLSCHAPHAASNKSLLVATGYDLCAQCHEEAIAPSEGKEAHQPFSRGQCSECHNPHGSEYKGILSGTEIDVCLKCHVDVKEEIEKRHPHTAVTQGCTSCHQPHQSAGHFLLKEEGEALCFKCHDSRQKEMARFVHYPYEEGVCRTCHLPHSGVGVGDLTMETDDLCTMCHRKKHKEFPHPVEVKAPSDFSLKPDNRLNFGPDDTVVCTTCHFPHTSDDVYLLKVAVSGGALCYECHQK